MAPTGHPRVGPLTSAEQMRGAAELYRRVFRYQDITHSVNPRLLTSLSLNGGSVVGATESDGSVIAFAYGFVGVSNGAIYHYSQAAVVDPAHQGEGWGRALKRAQRDVALSHGQTRMRWSYDPVLSRNGHFNLDVLGATGRWFRRAMYDSPGTDRIVVEWDLDDSRRHDQWAPVVEPCTAPAVLADPSAWFRAHPSGADVWLSLPVDLTAAANRSERTTLDLRNELSDVIEELMNDGHVAVSCNRVTSETAAYRFVRTEP